MYTKPLWYRLCVLRRTYTSNARVRVARRLARYLYTLMHALLGNAGSHTRSKVAITTALHTRSCLPVTYTLNNNTALNVWVSVDMLALHTHVIWCCVHCRQLDPYHHHIISLSQAGQSVGAQCPEGPNRIVTQNFWAPYIRCGIFRKCLPILFKSMCVCCVVRCTYLNTVGAGFG